MPLRFGGGLILDQLPHRGRLWRKGETRTHDRQLTTGAYADVYGSDIPMRLQPDVFSLEANLEGAPAPTPEQCILPARDSDGKRIRVQVAPPDVLEIKWTRQDGARRRIVETTLTANAAADATALSVANSWGFEPEEIIVLETAAVDDWYIDVVDTIVADTINLKHAVPTGNSFASGDTVKVAWTAKVIGTTNPLMAGLRHIVSLQMSESKWLLE